MTRAFPQERAGERPSGLVVIGQQAGIKDYDTARHPAYGMMSPVAWELASGGQEAG